MINTIMLSAVAFVQNTVVYTINKLREERGQDLTEYAVLVGAIALVAGFALFAIGPDMFETFTEEIEKCITFDEACGDF